MRSRIFRGIILLTKVEIYQASAGEFGGPFLAGIQAVERVTERLLMVIKPHPGRVELPANIHDQAAGLKDRWVPGPHYLRLPVPRQHLQQGAGQGLVAVEGTVVSPNGDLENTLELSGSTERG